jgi:acyl-CoA hydrolase
MTLPPKAARESATEMVQVVLPNDANLHGSVLGGTVMHWMDIAAAVAAHRHARSPVVTVCVDRITFEAPIRVGQAAVLQARLTHVGTSSMEVTVRVDCEDLNSGTRRRTSTAYFTMVAVDPAGRPVPVPPLSLETESEQESFRQAEARRARRLEPRTGGKSAG